VRLSALRISRAPNPAHAAIAHRVFAGEVGPYRDIVCLNAAAGLVVGFRGGAIVFRPAGHRHHRSLKYLCQSAAIVPWMRPHLPLVHGAPGGPAAGRLR
jgi:tRNA(Ile)-lysidine synthetase-like protein